MEKLKLIQARKKKRITQKEVAEFLCMHVSNYNRKEKGKLFIRPAEWLKIAEYLDLQIEEIYEDEQRVFISEKQYKPMLKNANNYTIPHFILECQKKYIQKLEEEIIRLKKAK